jgi:hypothetical protein
LNKKKNISTKLSDKGVQSCTGPYSSRDPKILEEHMSELKDFVVVLSWWGVFLKISCLITIHFSLSLKNCVFLLHSI